jgi:hypothetical protein
MEMWVSVISAVVAVVSTVITVWFGRRAERLDRVGLVDAHLERVRSWADETVGLLVQVIRECRNSSPEDGFESRVADLRTAISVQVERGRWFFPNLVQDQHGVAKDPAYRGLRQPVLDAVVAAFDICDDLSWKTRLDLRDDLIDAQRLFVSEIQAQLDPNRRYDKFEEILGDYRKAESQLRGESIERRRAWAHAKLRNPGPNSK